MNTVVKREFILEGLCCPNCAAGIEKDINKLKWVDTASLDFVMKKLTIEISEAAFINEAEIMKQINKIARNHEPDILVKELNSGKNSLNGGCKENNHTHDNNNIHDKNCAINNCSDSEKCCEDRKNRSFESKKSIIKSRYFNISKLVKNDEIKLGEIIQFLVGIIFFIIPVCANYPVKIELVLFLAAYILIGGEVVLRALRNIVRGKVFDENFLMTVATIGAFAIGEFPEGVAVMLFYQIGEFFQDMAVNRSRKSIAALMDIRPDFANLKLEGRIERVSPEDVRIGSLIVVKPGERVPLDGKVVEGKSALDVSALTGESVPKDVEVGDTVLSGSINKSGVLVVEVTKEFSESTVSKILDLVQNASSKKAPTENFITKFSRFYTPFVVFAAAALAVIPPLVIPGEGFAEWINRHWYFS